MYRRSGSGSDSTIERLAEDTLEPLVMPCEMDVRSHAVNINPAAEKLLENRPSWWSESTTTTPRRRGTNMKPPHNSLVHKE